MPFSLPPGATQVVLVRHGATQPAVEGIPFDDIDGQGDPDLAAEGIAQAAAVGARLAVEIPAPAAVYVSSMRRTAQTAAPYLAAIGMEARVEPDLREVHLGEWEFGAYRHRVAGGDPIAREMFKQERWDVIPGGEPAEAFAARAIGAIGRIAASHVGATVVAFAHGAIIGELARQATGSRGFAFIGGENTGVSRFIVGPAPFFRLRSFNDTSHLGG